MATKTPKTTKIVPPAASVEVAPTAVEVVSALASVEVAPTVVEFTAPTEENTMNTADTTPNTPEVPDGEKIGELLDLHDGIGSDIEALEAKLEELEARRDEIYGSLEVYRSELDGSKLTDEQAQEKLAEIKAGLMVKFGPMAKFIVPALFDGFTFAAPASLDLDPTTRPRLCELLEVGEGASAKADFSPMVRALTAHLLSVAEASEMTDTVKPKLNAVLLEMGLVKMAPPVAPVAEGNEKTLHSTWLELPDYPASAPGLRVGFKIYKSTKGVLTLGELPRNTRKYLDDVKHPDRTAAQQDLFEMARAWAKPLGYKVDTLKVKT